MQHHRHSRSQNCSESGDVGVWKPHYDWSHCHGESHRTGSSIVQRACADAGVVKPKVRSSLLAQELGYARLLLLGCGPQWTYPSGGHAAGLTTARFPTWRDGTRREHRTALAVAFGGIDLRVREAQAHTANTGRKRACSSEDMFHLAPFLCHTFCLSGLAFVYRCIGVSYSP